MGEQPGVRPRLTLTAKPAAPQGPPAGSKMRADLLAVEQGLFRSRNRAQSEIRAGNIFSGDKKVESASDMLDAGVKLTLKARANPFVSRGALKLVHALDHFGVDPKGKVCLDVGASTGGFTQVLLQRGAKKVFAVDVGRAQLHPSLHDHPRIVSMEETDIRGLQGKRLPQRPEIVVIDCSFISLKSVLPAALELAAAQMHLLALIKPQFEATQKSAKKGIVRDAAVHRAVCDDIAVFAAGLGCTDVDVFASAITGGDGNAEFFLGARRG